jgi:nickel/cobalt exporter
MTATILYGASSGVLHAVTGPDHVLSLGSVALRHPRGSARIGLQWGVGHGLGTLLLAVPLVLLSGLVQTSLISALAAWGERIAGLALLAAAAFSFWSLRHTAAAAAVDARSPLWVGVVHGITGASSLLMLMPVLLSGALQLTLIYLAAFSIGSTLAMVALTATIAKLGTRLSSRVIGVSQRVIALAAAGLGLYWLF